MLKPTDLRPGNIILFDHNDRRKQAVPLIRGIVEEVRKDKVVLKGDIVLGYDRIAGLPIDEDLLMKLGFERWKEKIYKKPWGKGGIEFIELFSDGLFYFETGVGNSVHIEFAHRLQNIFHDITCGQELKINVPEPPPNLPQQ